MSFTQVSIPLNFKVANLSIKKFPKIYEINFRRIKNVTRKVTRVKSDRLKFVQCLLSFSMIYKILNSPLFFVGKKKDLLKMHRGSVFPRLIVWFISVETVFLSKCFCWKPQKKTIKTTYASSRRRLTKVKILAASYFYLDIWVRRLNRTQKAIFLKCF